MQEFRKRLNKIRSLKDKVDGILLFDNDPNFFFFSNTRSGILFYDFSSPRLIATDFDILDVKKSWIKRIKRINARKKGEFLNKLTESIEGTIGVNKKIIPAALYEKLRNKIKLRDISNELEESRMIKSKYEINLIKRACRINKKTFSKINLKPGITENEIAGIAELTTRKLGGDAQINVAFGKNTAEPHHIPTDKKLKRNEPVWIDLCCYYKGYYSDVTRSFNHPLIKFLEEIVSELEIKPGIKAASLEKNVRERLGKYEKYFTHSLGHGIGVAIHERPWISSNSKDVLLPGMVFTIEPGIYNKNGVRVENDFLITSNGCRNLTDF